MGFIRTVVLRPDSERLRRLDGCACTRSTMALWLLVRLDDGMASLVYTATRSMRDNQSGSSRDDCVGSASCRLRFWKKTDSRSLRAFGNRPPYVPRPRSAPMRDPGMTADPDLVLDGFDRVATDDENRQGRSLLPSDSSDCPARAGSHDRVPVARASRSARPGSESPALPAGRGRTAGRLISR